MNNNIIYIFIIYPIFILLKFINKYVNNWGFSIIFITILIKLFTYPLSKVQYMSNLKLILLKPKLDEINNFYKNDDKLRNEKIMLLYKKENINIIQGIILLIIQMPIFFSLYYILTNFNELKNANFILWINDLSLKDPYYILPILMGISMFFMQIFSSNNIKIKFNFSYFIISIVFTFCFILIPSGLVLYYLTSNIVTIIQQIIIYKEFIKEYNE